MSAIKTYQDRAAAISKNAGEAFRGAADAVKPEVLEGLKKRRADFAKALQVDESKLSDDVLAQMAIDWVEQEKLTVEGTTFTRESIGNLPLGKLVLDTLPSQEALLRPAVILSEEVGKAEQQVEEGGFFSKIGKVFSWLFNGGGGIGGFFDRIGELFSWLFTGFDKEKAPESLKAMFAGEAAENIVKGFGGRMREEVQTNPELKGKVTEAQIQEMEKFAAQGIDDALKGKTAKPVTAAALAETIKDVKVEPLNIALSALDGAETLVNKGKALLNKMESLASVGKELGEATVVGTMRYIEVHKSVLAELNHPEVKATLNLIGIKAADQQRIAYIVTPYLNNHVKDYQKTGNLISGAASDEAIKKEYALIKTELSAALKKAEIPFYDVIGGQIANRFFSTSERVRGLVKLEPGHMDALAVEHKARDAEEKQKIFSAVKEQAPEMLKNIAQTTIPALPGIAGIFGKGGVAVANDLSKNWDVRKQQAMPIIIEDDVKNGLTKKLLGKDGKPTPENEKLKEFAGATLGKEHIEAIAKAVAPAIAEIRKEEGDKNSVLHNDIASQESYKHIEQKIYSALHANQSTFNKDGVNLDENARAILAFEMTDAYYKQKELTPERQKGIEALTYSGTKGYYAEIIGPKVRDAVSKSLTPILKGEGTKDQVTLGNILAIAAAKEGKRIDQDMLTKTVEQGVVSYAAHALATKQPLRADEFEKNLANALRHSVIGLPEQQLGGKDIAGMIAHSVTQQTKDMLAGKASNLNLDADGVLKDFLAVAKQEAKKQLDGDSKLKGLHQHDKDAMLSGFMKALEGVAKGEMKYQYANDNNWYNFAQGGVNFQRDLMGWHVYENVRKHLKHGAIGLNLGNWEEDAAKGMGQAARDIVAPTAEEKQQATDALKKLGQPFVQAMEWALPKPQKSEPAPQENKPETPSSPEKPPQRVQNNPVKGFNAVDVASANHLPTASPFTPPGNPSMQKAAPQITT